MSFEPHTPDGRYRDPMYGSPDPPPRRGLQVFGFPLRIDPFFFVTAWLIGGRQEPQWMLVWVVLVLVPKVNLQVHGLSIF